MTSWWLIAALIAAPALGGDLFEHPQTPAQAQATLHAVLPELRQAEVLRGHFSQRKFLREVPRPLISTGEFLLVRDRGICWHTLTPLDSELILSFRHDAHTQAQPGVQVAASLFLSVFALDLDALTRDFSLYAMPSGTRWLLGLRPRDAALTAWFEQATLSGHERVEQLVLFEAAGDRTEIDLDAKAQLFTSLTAAERQRFEP